MYFSVFRIFLFYITLWWVFSWLTFICLHSYPNFTIRLWKCDISFSLAPYPNYLSTFSSLQPVYMMYITKLVSWNDKKEREQYLKAKYISLQQSPSECWCTTQASRTALLMKAKATQNQTMVQFHASFQTSLNVFGFTSSSPRSQKETGALINVDCRKRGREETS